MEVRPQQLLLLARAEAGLANLVLEFKTAFSRQPHRGFLNPQLPALSEEHMLLCELYPGLGLWVAVQLVYQ